MLQKVKHWLRCRLDCLAKRDLLDTYGWYPNLKGGWCNSHGWIMMSRQDYAVLTLNELKTKYFSK